METRNFILDFTSGDSADIQLPEGGSFTSTIERTSSEFYNKLSELPSSEARVITIIKEATVDPMRLIEKNVATFKSELARIAQEYKSRYDDERRRLEQLVRDNFIGKRLQELTTAMSEIGWVLVLNKGKAIAYKQYSPAFPVTQERFDNGVLREYEKPICYLAGFGLDLSYPNVCGQSLQVDVVEGEHPNVNRTTVCAGSLEDKPINLSDIGSIIQLLREIQSTYEIAGGSSPYHSDHQSWPHKIITEQSYLDLD